VLALLFLLLSRPAPAESIRFQEVASQAGLGFVLHHHPTPQKHLIETMPGGLAAFDYDGDGLTDIFFSNGAAIPSLEKDHPQYHNRLFRNLGGMKFQDVTAKAGVSGHGYSMGAAVADYDNDGHVDLFVAGVNRNILYRNRGDGAFEDVTQKAGIRSGMWSVAAGWFDFDNDGLLDLFVVNYLNWSPQFDRYCGDRQAGIRLYCHPRFFEGLPNTLYRNRGDGAFEDVTKGSGIERFNAKSMSVAFADYDGDGRLDIFVTSDTQPNLLFRNLGGGRFEEMALLAGVAFNSDGRPVSAMGVDFRDYDNDGLPDINFTALNNETFPLFRNAGDGNFQDVTFRSNLGKLSMTRGGWANGFFDFDNDGWKDLFTANSHVNDEIHRFEASSYRQPNSIFRNLGNGKFDDVSPQAGEAFQQPRAHRGAAFADFDNDGRIDVVVTCLGEPAELWRNTTRRAGNWLVLKLQGTRSNRDGIGAIVRIGNQVNHMTTAIGYASSSHAGLHFGLADQERVAEIEIRWPSGVVQRVRNVPANQVLSVTEPAE
jgi:hypothetical protein